MIEYEVAFLHVGVNDGLNHRGSIELNPNGPDVGATSIEERLA